MVLRRWDPFSDVRCIQGSMEQFWRIGQPQAAGSRSAPWPAPLDVSDQGDHFLVEASLPGLKPEDIEVSVEDHVLSIKGGAHTEGEQKRGEHIIRERRSGAFHRSLLLPNTVDTERAAPHYEDGVLTITLPKTDAKRSRQLKVTTGKVLEGGSE